MRIGFVVNEIATEKPGFTTTRLAFAAKRAGHEVYTIAVGDLSQQADGAVAARANRPADKNYRALNSFASDLLDGNVVEDIRIDDLDVLMLRNDPAADAIERPWAQRAGVHFGQLAVTRGVLVLNDPLHLADAIDKTYFQHFPESVRPETMISRDPIQITEFVEAHRGRAVLKPLQGSGGQGVFVLSGRGQQNVNQIIESITRDGFVVAQEYLKDAENGDVRIFVMNGEPLKVGNAYAAFRRRSTGSDPRSNMHVGGEAERVKLTDDVLELIQAVKPKLIRDGMFLVGLDVIGDMLMEVNVFSPGGLGSAGMLEDADFSMAVIEAIEHKVSLRERYGSDLTNTELATL